MTAPRKDPLLVAGRVLLIFAEILFVFSMVMVAIGFAAVLTVQRAQVMADLTSAGAPGDVYLAILAVLFLVAVLLNLCMLFVRKFRKVVESVDEGDPFRPENARLLVAMGWYALGHSSARS